MATEKRRFCYTMPPILRPVEGTENWDEPRMERIPDHPKRKARDWEIDSWVEEVEYAE